MPQDQHPSTSWSQNMDQASLGPGVGDEDFTKFLDLDNSFDHFQQIDSGHGQSSLNTPMGRLAFGQDDMQDLDGHNSQEMLQDLDMSQYQSYQMYQTMNQSHHYQIPPTPVSAEMHAAKYGGHLDTAGQIIFDRHQASFTPLVSPAQTPLDNTFCMPDYVLSDDFFSPLTSPAIEAQPTFASTSSTASPIDLNGDHMVGNTATSSMRKRARKANVNPPRPARSVKQSPAMKPQQKRRQFSITSVPHERLEMMMMERAGNESRLQPDAARNAAFVSSEDSVSPEPLSEALMRPPPVPSNAGRSPAGLQPRSSDPNLPATPAMIMRMPSKQPGSADHNDPQNSVQDVMEDIALPDSATTLSAKLLLQVEPKECSTDDQSTPTLSAKTPKFNSASTPRASAVRLQSNSSESLDKSKKSETKVGGRGGKKRQSISSATISPALRPKISPSISPLVPAPGSGIGSMSAETSALLLASKSNYQNILDGTHLPGVSYPEALAENLSSKRTSHKLAEQGRRNRINIALKEIESLLPASITAAAIKKEKANSTLKDSEEGSDKPSSSGQNAGASKASTVEMAITYIKSLQAELQETREKLEVAERTIAQGSSNASQSSE